MIIDPPSPFASRDEWQRFLKEMQALLKQDPGNPDAEHYLEEAREALGE